MELAYLYESFADVERRLASPPVSTAQEWLLGGDDRHEVVDLLRDLGAQKICGPSARTSSKAAA